MPVVPCASTASAKSRMASEELSGWICPSRKPGGQILSLRVHHPGALADAVFHIAHGSDGVAADGHAAVIDLTGIDIDHLAVPDHQIGRSLTLRNGQ